jgi:hypothetical protein
VTLILINFATQRPHAHTAFLKQRFPWRHSDRYTTSPHRFHAHLYHHGAAYTLGGFKHVPAAADVVLDAAV